MTATTPLAPRERPCRQDPPIRPVGRGQVVTSICKAIGQPVRVFDFDDGDGRVLIVEPLMFIPILHSTVDSFEGQPNNV